MTRQQRIKLNERFRLNYERNYHPKIKKVLTEIRQDFVKTVSEQGIAAAQSRLANSALFEEKIARVMLQLYIAAGTAKAKLVYNQLIQEVYMKSMREGIVMRKDLVDPNWVQLIVDFFNRYLFIKIVRNIYANTRDYFETKIKEMLTEGQSIDWLVQQVTNPTLEDYRARMIARTESNRAINYGADIAAKDSGFDTTKEWVSVHDDRTRHSHQLLDGVIIPMDQPFKEGLMYPGDPNAPGHETINCRCHLEYRSVRDAEGLLVPKQGVSSPTQYQLRELQRIQRIMNPYATAPIN